MIEQLDTTTGNDKCFKITLRDKQTYIGSKERGQLKASLEMVARRILDGKIKIPTPQVIVRETVACRFSAELVYQLMNIADNNEISLQELLRLGLEQCNLVIQPDQEQN
jgi:hypothetical protein